MNEHSNPIDVPKVLIVDDNPANLDLLTAVLEPQGYRIMIAQSGEGALTLAGRAMPDLILMDIMLPGIDGYEACRRLKRDALTADIPVLFISARNDTLSVVNGFGAGGVDYVTKPFQSDEVVSRVGTHLRLSTMARELHLKNMSLEKQARELKAANEKLQAEIGRREEAEVALETAGEQISVLAKREAQRWGIEGFVGKSRCVQKVVAEVKRLGNFGSVNVLVKGESGTGKELVARAIHSGSARGKGPFIAVNCASIPQEWAESMFFGHVAGAVAGTVGERKGYFELANNGTLFLDEIGDMSSGLQGKLLRILEDGRVTPLGSNRERKVNVRVIAATNADLEGRIAAGHFRQDLYFRLARFTVELPPLRERRGDVALLSGHFLSLFAAEMGMRAPGMTAETLETLEAYDFPGNVRELKNVIERGLIESGGEQIRPEHLKLSPAVNTAAVNAGMEAAEPVGAGLERVGLERESGVTQLPLRLDLAEGLLIKRALAETGGNVAEAARRLGINRTRIYRRLANQVSPES